MWNFASFRGFWLFYRGFLVGSLHKSLSDPVGSKFINFGFKKRSDTLVPRKSIQRFIFIGWRWIAFILAERPGRYGKRDVLGTGRAAVFSKVAREKIGVRVVKVVVDFEYLIVIKWFLKKKVLLKLIAAATTILVLTSRRKEETRRRNLRCLQDDKWWCLE